MTIEVKWKDNEKTIVLLNFAKNWAWSDVPEARQLGEDLMKSVDHIVDTIVDIHIVDRVPPGSLSVWRGMQNARLRNEGITVIVTTSIMAKMLFRGYTTAYPLAKHIYYLTETMEEAEQLVHNTKQNRGSLQQDTLQE